MTNVNVETKLREAFERSVEGMEYEEKIIFCQTLINTDPPEDLLGFLAAMTGTSADFIRDTARMHARETLERLAN